MTISSKNIHYTKFPGNFLKHCPGTPKYRCCNYYVLNIQTNCNLGCQYCILQDYISNDTITVFTNIDQALAEVDQTLKAHPDRFYRIGTGELTDSLSLDHQTGHSLTLIPFFSRYRNALLELKTKTDNIGNLLKLKPGKNIVISWSLNPQKIISSYEWHTASLKQRLIAAEKCSHHGYRISFHLDPVILYPGWENDYRLLVEQIPKYVPPENIVWISIAGLRYTQPLKNIIQARFPHSRLFSGEMIKALDGKFRYLRPIRTAAYKKIIGWIHKYGPDIPIYFCMESPAVWRQVFGKLPEEIPNLKGIFDSTWWDH